MQGVIQEHGNDPCFYRARDFPFLPTPTEGSTFTAHVRRHLMLHADTLGSISAR